mgnify:CR=1 FL=1
MLEIGTLTLVFLLIHDLVLGFPISGFECSVSIGFKQRLIMNTRKIKILLTLVMLCTIVGVKAQNAIVNFGYDVHGNRTQRYLSFKKIEENGRSLEANVEEILSATDYFKENQVSLFPNPTYGMFSVTMTGKSEESICATLSTATGSIVQECRLTGLENIFDLSGQPAGVYLLRLSTENDTHVWKIVKR